MKTMLYSDFLSIRSSLPQTLLIPLVVAIVCTIFGAIVFAGAIVCAMIPLTIVFGVQLYDDQKDWSGYRLTLPINRRQVVWGRYLFMALCVIGAFLMGSAIVVICGLLFQSGLLPHMSSTLPGASAGEFALFNEFLSVGLAGAYGGLLFELLLLAITLPLLMRYGLTQAIRFVPVVFCIIFILVMVWLGDSGSGLLLWLNTIVMEDGALWLCFGLIALCCALYIASAAIASRLYATREF